MANNNFMKQYSTIKSEEECEREKSIKRDAVAKKVCDYWKNRMLTETTLVLTDGEKSDIEEVFQELEAEIKEDELYNNLSSEDYATIDDFDIINRINRKINKGEYVERDIMSHIDSLTGKEIEMNFSLDYIYIINHKPAFKNTNKRI